MHPSSIRVILDQPSVPVVVPTTAKLVQRQKNINSPPRQYPYPAIFGRVAAIAGVPVQLVVELVRLAVEPVAEPLGFVVGLLLWTLEEWARVPSEVKNRNCCCSIPRYRPNC
jgi:hypothetical protein